jgi:hypothetical protein
MPHYHFHLRANSTISPDRAGTDLQDLPAARAHAIAVATELMRNASTRTRLWSMIVEDGEERQFDLFFADVDPSLDPKRRMLVCETCRRLAALTDTWFSVSTTLTESRILLAKARRSPILVYQKSEHERL